MLLEEEKKAIEDLKDFKSISILYGNTFTIFLEQLKKYQEATDTVLNLIEKLQKENEEKDKQINLIIEYFLNELHKYTSFGGVAEFCKNKKTVECYKTKCSICIKEYFSKLSKKEGE